MVSPRYDSLPFFLIGAQNLTHSLRMLYIELRICSVACSEIEGGNMILFLRELAYVERIYVLEVFHVISLSEVSDHILLKSTLEVKNSQIL